MAINFKYEKILEITDVEKLIKASNFQDKNNLDEEKFGILYQLSIITLNYIFLDSLFSNSDGTIRKDISEKDLATLQIIIGIMIIKSINGFSPLDFFDYDITDGVEGANTSIKAYQPETLLEMLPYPIPLYIRTMSVYNAIVRNDNSLLLINDPSVFVEYDDLKNDIVINVSDVDGETTKDALNTLKIAIGNITGGKDLFATIVYVDEEIKKLDKSKINSFEGSNLLHPNTYTREDGKIIVSDLYNKQLLTDNKYGKGAINENFKKIETNIKDIKTNKNNIGTNKDNIIDRFVRFTDDNSERTSIKFDPNSFAINGGYELYVTELWNPKIEGRNLVNFVVKTREMVEGKINGLISTNEQTIIDLNTNFFNIGIKNNLELIEPTDFKNRNLKGTNKTAVAAINWIYDLAVLNEKYIVTNTQEILRNGNLIELLFEIFNSKVEAYVKSYTIKGTYYEPKYVATAKGKNNVSDPKIIDQISNKEHKIFSGFSANLGVTAVFIINESSVGDVKFTLLKDGKKVSETITKTLTGKKMRLSLVFKKYSIIDDKKDHIYMILSEGVEGAWYNIAYLGLEFTILGVGSGTGGDVSLSYVNNENERQDKEHQLKLDNKLNTYKDATDLMEGYFEVDATTGNIYAAEFWNRAIGGDATKYMLTTRKIVDEDRVPINFDEDMGLVPTKIIKLHSTKEKVVIESFGHGEYYGYDYVLEKYTLQGDVNYHAFYSDDGDLFERYLANNNDVYFLIKAGKNKDNSIVNYTGQYTSGGNLANWDNVEGRAFLIKKEFNKIKGINQTDEEVADEILDELENFDEIKKLFNLRKEKRNGRNRNNKND